MIDRFNQFTRVVSQMNKSLQRIKREGMEDLGLKGSHVMCLHKLGSARDGLTAAELAEACQEDKAAISRCVAELQEKGLVELRGDRKYRASITLTESGRSAVEEVDRRITRAVSAISASMNAPQRLVFYETLEEISRNLKNFSFSEGSAKKEPE